MFGLITTLYNGLHKLMRIDISHITFALSDTFITYIFISNICMLPTGPTLKLEESTVLNNYLTGPNTMLEVCLHVCTMLGFWIHELTFPFLIFKPTFPFPPPAQLAQRRNYSAIRLYKRSELGQTCMKQILEYDSMMHTIIQQIKGHKEFKFQFCSKT